jgi:hypothetical protein
MNETEEVIEIVMKYARLQLWVDRIKKSGE